MLFVLLQDSDPPVRAVVGDGRSVVPPGAVVVQDHPALPLLRGEAWLGRRGGIQPGEAKNRRRGGSQKSEQQMHCF